MEDTSTENQDSLNLDENQDSKLETEVVEETPEELKARLKEAEEKANSQRIRADRAEKALKASKPVAAETETPKNDKDLSGDDMYALMEAKVSREDLPDVKKTALALGLSIPDALNHIVLKTILKTKAEERATAAATSTGNTRRASKTNTDEVILKDLENNIVSEKPEDIEKLVQAQLNRRIAESKRN